MDQPAQDQTPENQETPEDTRSPEQKLQEEQRATLEEQTPEGQQIAQVLQLGGALFLLKTQNYLGVANALNLLSDREELTNHLFDFDHPAKATLAREALTTGERKLQKKDSQKQGFAQEKFLFWKSKTLTPDQHKRAVFATAVARRVHRRINTTTSDIKIRNALTIYGVTDEKQFRALVNDWLKKNPGRTLDDAVVVVGAQNAGLGGQEKKQKEKELREENRGAYKKAVKQHEEEIKRGKEVAEKILDPNNPTPSLQGLPSQIQYVEKGETPAPPTPPLQPAPQTTLPVPAPSMMPRISFSLPKISLPQISLPIGKIGNLFNIGLSKIGGKLLTSIGGFLGKQALIKGLGGALTGGALTVASLAADGLKLLSFGLIDIEKWAKYLALGAIGIVVGVMLIAIIGLFSATPGLFPPTPPTSSSQISPIPISYNKEGSWLVFEKENLLPKPIRLSLDKK